MPKKLRTPTIHKEFVLNKVKKIPLDTNIRWSSTFLMLETIIEQQSFILSVFQKHDQQLVAKFKSLLPHINMYLNCLKPVAIATKMLQSEQLTIGDLFKIWLEL